MLLELRTVSRKTPRDGKLEISAATAHRLAVLGAELAVQMGGVRGAGALISMPCTCAKSADGAHVHHFLQSELFRALAPEMPVQLHFDENEGAVHVSEHP